MKKSIFKNGNIVYGVDYSKREDCEEVIEIPQEQFLIETKNTIGVQDVVELTEEEKAKVDEDALKEYKEIKLQELEKYILRKQALDILGEDTTDIEDIILLTKQEILDSKKKKKPSIK